MITPLSGDGCWRWSRDRYLDEKKRGNIEFKQSNGVLINSLGLPSKWNVYTKIWLTDREDEGMVPVDLITKWENRQSKKELQELGIPFDFAKPVDLIKYLISIVEDNSDAIVLDFFSGSATTAHSVLDINNNDCGTRKFIMVQLPENLDESLTTADTNSKESLKNAIRFLDSIKRPHTISEIGEERIRRAGKKIKNENPLTTGDLDIGFRVFRVDSSNMKDVYYSPNDYDQNQLNLLSDNIKGDRTPEDLLFQVMIDLGVLLSSKIEETIIAGKKVFSVADGYLIACFDNDVTEEVVKAIAQKHPFYAVFRDSSIASDSVMANFDQIFETYSPKTQRKVL